MKLYREIASTLEALRFCQQAGDRKEWEERHSSRLREMQEMLPSGSGIDSGCKIDFGSPKGKIVIVSSYHKMDENGYYCGWFPLTATVSPSLTQDFELTIRGKGLKDDLEYLYETFDFALHQDV